MKTLVNKIRVGLILLATIVLGSTVAAQTPAQSPPLEPLASQMEKVIQPYVASKRFMGAILVAHGAEILLSKGYGFANLEWNIPDSPAAEFWLASLTKQFTAASTLLLEERGKLRTDDLVKKYIPDAPASWDKITIFNLLTHTSGIPDYAEFPDFISLMPFPTTPKQLLGRFLDKPLDFEPGQKFKYSNSGYVVLGYLIEKISGESYQKFLQENIFTPLEMKDTGYDSNSAIIPRRVSGYEPSPEGLVNARFIDTTVAFSAGGLYSTTEDLLRWELGLFGNRLLSPASLQKMTTPFKDDYAFGLEVQTVNGRKVLHHNGNIFGFENMLAYYPQDKVTVIVLGNVSGPASGEIARQLEAMAHSDPTPQAIHLSPEILQAFAGSYQPAALADMQLPPGHTQRLWEITADQEGLWLSRESGRKHRFLPFSPTEFFDADHLHVRLTFTKNENGQITGLTLTNGGPEGMKANKLP